MSVVYKAVEAVSGVPIADLPNFTVDALRFTLGRPETMVGYLPISGDKKAPENWVAASDPWCVAILPIESSNGQVLGSGMYINGRTRTQGDVATIPLVSGEGYLDRRQTGAYAPVLVDQNTILGQLVTQFAITPSLAGLNGWPASVNVIGAAGKTRTRTYAVADRKTLLSNLTELMGDLGGPEWTVTWQHLTGPERYFPVFNVGTRIGTPAAAGLLPNVSFQLGGTLPGGSLTDFAYTEDWSNGNGANYIAAYGLTDATTGLSPQQVAAYTGNPRQLEIDYVFNPSTSISDSATLLNHAQTQLAIMQKGTRSLALTVRGNKVPQFGIDFFLGDDCQYKIGGKTVDGAESIPSLPGGLSGVTRVIGVQMRPDIPTPTTTPILGGV